MRIIRKTAVNSNSERNIALNEDLTLKIIFINLFYLNYVFLYIEKILQRQSIAGSYYSGHLVQLGKRRRNGKVYTVGNQFRRHPTSRLRVLPCSDISGAFSSPPLSSELSLAGCFR